jgi:hypothetical protein
MKVIIAGSRTVTSYDLVTKAILDSGFKIGTVVSGCARGVDRLGERFAMEAKLPVSLFPAEWDVHGPAAGPIRNKKMGDYADALIAIRVNMSRGTSHMIEYATGKGLRVYVVDITEPAL